MQEVGVVADEVGEYLKLPSRIFINFSNTDLYGWGHGRNMGLTRAGVDYFLAGKRQAFAGLIAHELSHLSDFASRNNCTNDGQISSLISEGKAEEIGLTFGGEQYIDELECNEVDMDDKATFYGTLLSGKNARQMIYEYGDHYTIGLSMVHDVLGTLETDIFLFIMSQFSSIPKL